MQPRTNLDFAARAKKHVESFNESHAEASFGPQIATRVIAAAVVCA